MKVLTPVQRRPAQHAAVGLQLAKVVKVSLFNKEWTGKMYRPAKPPHAFTVTTVESRRAISLEGEKNCMFIVMFVKLDELKELRTT